ncbi:MAG: DNA gyrase inhibitor YacG [Pirellulaceae bacterium]|jgi:uncharacterized protein|nr:DNA gyrase inhibitor YacG [Pirellulaceae bacterium]
MNSNSTNGIASGNGQVKTKMLRCSRCSTPYPLGTRFRPFCSERCQQLDLRLWLTESYGLPYEDLSRPEEIFEE